MKHLKTTTFIIIIALFATFTSCGSDDDGTTTEITGESSKGFVMALRTAGDTETDFIISKEDIMTGEISAIGNGIEQTSWRFFYPVGKTLFSTGYSEDNQGTAYVVNGEGIIEQKGVFVFENALEMFGHTDDNSTLLAMEIVRNPSTRIQRLHFIDTETALVQDIKDISIFEEINATDQASSVISWPTALEVRGDKLYIPFHKINPDFTTVDPDVAYVAIYSYPNIGTEPEKIISDDRTSNIGVNGATTGLIEADNGNLYSFSCGAKMAGFTTASAKPSGILRINANETEFDSTYFLDVEATTGGARIFSLDYAGGTKAIARVLTNDDGEVWSAFARDAASFNQKLVIIDLETQTVTDVANIPLHAKRYTSPILVENGKAYVSIETATDAHVYQIDIESATGTKGAKIIGKTIKGFFRLE